MRTDEAPPRFERVAVLGLGLMGGSLARALRGLAIPPRVVGWSPDASEVRAAEEQGVVDRIAADALDAAADADLVVLATPLEPACRLMASLARAMEADALLTDVVSLKAPVRDAARIADLARRWVGSHPMCGGDRSGFGASRADLYQDARVWIVGQDADPADVARVEAFWSALGARPARTEAEDHDALMALASHLPQLTANALARVLEAGGVAPDDLGPGGRDMTRLAGSSPGVWRDLLAHAPPSLPDAMRETAARLAALAALVDRGDLDALEAWMSTTRTWRTGS